MRKWKTVHEDDSFSWEDFRESGLLWWINRQLHLFQVSIACEVEEDGSVSKVYPVRSNLTQGFREADEIDGFFKLENFMLSVKPTSFTEEEVAESEREVNRALGLISEEAYWAEKEAVARASLNKARKAFHEAMQVDQDVRSESLSAALARDMGQDKEAKSLPLTPEE